ncbi:MAG TPA: CoA transferase [Chloroflexota bacterium]|nr:CoA transferase [Chloroflexota bacterium]
MGAPDASPSALDGLRVLDLAGPMGAYCGKLLADLGADVLRIEPPTGDPSRRLPPYYQDQPGLERSLFYWHFNTNKRGLTLDITKPAGQDLFLRLIPTADVVIETYAPGYLASLGLGYEDLDAINSGIIVTSITPFGQTGPYSHYLGGELIGQAAGGLLWMCGWPDRRPVMMGGGPAMHQASAEGAAGALLALEFRELTGRGQQVDVSVQACMPLTLMASMPEYHRLGVLRQPRVGNFHGSALNGMFACSDGYADFRFRGRPGQWTNLVEWLASEGMAEDLEDEKYRDAVFRRQKEVYEHIDEVFQRFIVRYTREEAMDLSQRKGLEVGAVYTAEDILADPQLQERGFFVDVPNEHLGRTFRYPGGPYTLSETPWRLRRRAPILGEHNDEIYGGELGLTETELRGLRADGAI